MIKDRQARNTVNCRICGATTLLVAALVGFADARTETGSRSAQATANAPDGILDQIAVGRAATLAPLRQETSLAGNPLWTITLDSLTETRVRPIFSPSRRPPPPPVVAAAPPPQPKPSPPSEPERLKLALLGTVIGASNSIGVFVDESSKEVIRIRTGGSHDGWTLRSLHPRAASFEKNHQETTLVLSPPAFEQSPRGAGVATSGTGGANISGNDRGAGNSVENRARPAAPILPVSAPTTRSAHKIRQDILSIGATN
jgi:general secretion pathway protein N